MRVGFLTQYGSAFFGMNSVSTTLFWHLVILALNNPRKFKKLKIGSCFWDFPVYHGKHVVKNHDMLEAL